MLKLAWLVKEDGDTHATLYRTEPPSWLMYDAIQIVYAEVKVDEDDTTDHS